MLGAGAGGTVVDEVARVTVVGELALRWVDDEQPTNCATATATQATASFGPRRVDTLLDRDTLRRDEHHTRCRACEKPAVLVEQPALDEADLDPASGLVVIQEPPTK